MDRLLLDSDKVKRPENPRKNANIIEILTFSWLVNLFKTGLKRDLNENDLYAPLSELSSALLGNELEKKWSDELDDSNKTNRNPSLLRVLIQIYGGRYLLCGFSHAVNELVIKMVQPLCIGGLLSYFSSNSSDQTDLRYAYVCTFVLILSMFISTIAYHTTQIEIIMSGMKIKVSCCSAIYRKALRISHTALGETTTGQVINLISNDASRFDMSLLFFHYLWIGPLQTIMITCILWREIGVSSLLGVAMLLIFIPLQGWIGVKTVEFRSKTAKLTGERVRLMNAIISGIQVIKMFTWEKPFAKLMEFVRRKEIQQMKGFLFFKTISISFKEFQCRIQLLVIILSYVCLGNYVSVQKVYVLMNFYSLLGMSMGLFFSQAPVQLAELLVSIKRIQHFLMTVEKDSPKSLRSDTPGETHANGDGAKNYVTRRPSHGAGIVLSNATAKWACDQTNNTLDNINFTAVPGTLVAIIGSVGAGKSSLLQAILGELPVSGGDVSVRGVVSYASQEPWLFTGSVMENILFGTPMDGRRYRQVVEACALNTDLERFPLGDRTLVGERGITLSGGQRARINLARAIYKHADIYLLDDPLSAVDTRVGKHLYEKCIKGYLKEKTCVLITHQIQFLTDVNHIVLMENASIKVTGSYRQLRDSGYDFSKLLGFSKETVAESQTECNNANQNRAVPNQSAPRPDESIELSDIDRDAGQPAEEEEEEEETHFAGRVSKNVFISYCSSYGSLFKPGIVLVTYVLTQVSITFGDLWISYWVLEEEEYFNANSTIGSNGTSIARDPSDGIFVPTDFRFTRLTVYVAVTVSLVLAVLTRSAIFVSTCTKVSINFHDTMYDAITKTTMHFFNVNSSGRILNRFSKDIGAVDENLPVVLFNCLQILAQVLGIVFIVGHVNIYLMIPSIMVGVVFCYLRTIYLPTSRSVKRLEGIARSPMYGHAIASIQGLITIRAHKTERFLTREFDEHQDLHTSACYMFVFINQAFASWCDIVCSIYSTAIICSLLFMDKYINGADVGLIITQITSLAVYLQWGLRQSAVLENEMTSVERLLEYSDSPREESKSQSARDGMPPDEWPSRGEIVFQNVSLQYGPNTPRVLNNLDVTIQPREKVGIVGRTGAGKSSIITALFRLARNEGNIFIDAIEIHSLALHELRSKMSIIPQEPVLFSGTMRTNLDPFDEYPDHVLWDALDKMELKKTIENLPGSLNTKMSESGSNFSVGQRQLVCLARAIVRNNKILVLDEATANVDPQTDSLIQNTIRKYFKTCTVLTIAHRLNTVMDSDKIIVMDEGRMVEFDHSHNLLKIKDGYFHKMVEQTGRATADLLKRTAAESYKSATSKH